MSDYPPEPPAPPPYQPVQPPPAYSPYPITVVGPTFPKEKAVAIVLAVLLGPWTFLYTYKRDSGIFWLNMLLGFFGCWFLWPIVAWIWAIVAACVRPDSFYRNFPNA